MKKKKYQTGVQMVGAAPLPPKPNPGATATGALTGAASGAAAGAALGPPGMIIGGLLGGITSLIGSGQKKKEAERHYAEQMNQWRDQRMDQLDGQVMDFNTLIQQQNQLAKNGLYTTGTKAVEVEKDELIFTRTPTGKYVLKADFKDGKRHDQGGEDYIADAGDIIFPGKDRDKVMRAYKSHDTPKLEAMRLSLPKDTNVAKDGLNNEDPIKRYKRLKYAVDAGELDQGYLDAYVQEHNIDVNNIPEETGEPEPAGGLANWLSNAINASPFNTNFFTDNPIVETSGEGLEDAGNWIVDKGSAALDFIKDNNLLYNAIYGDEENEAMSKVNVNPNAGSNVPGDKNFIGPTNNGTKKTGGGKAKVDPFPANKEIPTKKIGIDQIGQMGVAPEMPSSVKINEMMKQSQANAQAAVDASKAQFAADKATRRANNLATAGNIAGYVAQAGAALSNLFPGEAEVQRSPLVQLDNMKYEDTSDYLRDQSRLAQQVQASNARNTSGGNVANYRANRRQAGLEHMRRLQGINNQEFARAQAIANQNVQINNRETMLNNQIQRGDLEANAANRAMAGNIRRQGMGQLGELGGLIARDTNQARSEREMINTLNDMGLYEFITGGGVNFKGYGSK